MEGFDTAKAFNKTKEAGDQNYSFRTTEIWIKKRGNAVRCPTPKSYITPNSRFSAACADKM